MLAFAIYQHDSVIGVHVSPPSWTLLPPPTPTASYPSRLSQSTDLSSLSHTANPWLSVLHIAVCMFPCYSPFVPPLLPRAVPHTSTSLFISTILPDSWMCINIWYSLFSLTYFTLYKQAPGSPTSLELTRAPFGGLVIPHPIYVVRALDLPTCRWTPRWPPCPAVVKGAAASMGLRVSLQLWFYHGACPVVGLWGHRLGLFPVF